MIISQLSGGLGNQMFQYAAAQSLAWRLKTDCLVDTSALKINIRKYELNIFSITPKIVKLYEIPFDFYLNRLPGFRLIEPWIGNRNLLFKKIKRYKEMTDFTFDSEFNRLYGNIYLEGYFQSEKYFNQFASKIRDAFTFKVSPTKPNIIILDEIIKTNSISVHIRRGDYISDLATNQFHGTCPISYYESAFRLIKSLIKNPTFFVFSDDPDWTKKNIIPPGDTKYIGHNLNNLAYEDMRLMSKCKHHIIANSSFSWWGAWLNPNPQKIVVAPKKWLSTEKFIIRDLIPQYWHQL